MLGLRRQGCVGPATKLASAARRAAAKRIEFLLSTCLLLLARHADRLHDDHHLITFMTYIMYIVKWYPHRGKDVRVTRKQAEANREKVSTWRARSSVSVALRGSESRTS